MSYEFSGDAQERFSLAMHETLELHELTAMQSNRLLENKKIVGKISDPQLRAIYLKCIQVTELQLREILQLLQYRPTRRG